MVIGTYTILLKEKSKVRKQIFTRHYEELINIMFGPSPRIFSNMLGHNQCLQVINIIFVSGFQR